jgi:hypothetical protein
MSTIWNICYNLILSLWIGGIVIFTFLTTPAIFRSFERDMAGKIVGTLFTGYFAYNLVLSVLALILLVLLRSLLTGAGFKLSLILVICAIVINLFVTFKLHPDIRKVKQEIHTFNEPAGDSALRRKFGKLHAVSASLNLLLLADGITLLVLSIIKKH